MRHLLAMPAALALLLPGILRSADDPDPVGEAVKAARSAYDGAVDEARAKLLAELDKWVENARKAGNLDAVRDLTEQKEAFQATDALPDAAQLKSGRGRYESSLRSARRGLAKALKAAEVSYTKADQLDLARDAQEERLGIEEALGADAPKKGPDAPDSLLQPDSHWAGRSSIESRDPQGRLLHEQADTEMIVKARHGNRFTFQFTGKYPDGRATQRDHEGVLGRVERSGKVVRRRFTWGEGPGIREGWISGETISTAQASPDNRWRSTGRSSLVKP